MIRYGVIVVTSNSLFLLKEPERRISRGYCRGVRLNNVYLCVYWAGGPIRGREIVRGGANIVRGVRVSK